MSKANKEQLYRRIFILVVLTVMGIIILALGPVWLSAEATRAAQHAELLKAEIADRINESENLEMRRAALTSSDKLEQLAVRELGMVREDPNRMYVELAAGTDVQVGGNTDTVASLAIGARVATATQTESTELESKSFATVTRSTLDTLARLTAGEASTLLVGDVGLASMR